MTSLELKDKQAQLITRCKEIVANCKKEVREMTDEEQKEFDENKEEIKNLRNQLEELQKKLASYDEELPSDEDENRNADEQDPDPEADKENKSNRNMKKVKFNLMKELRSAYEKGETLTLSDLESRAYTVTAEGEDVVQTDIYDIWEPLRAKSVLAEAGVRMITGIKNNVQIPLMDAVDCKWASETGTSYDGSKGFTAQKLTPKRITAKYPISLELLAQDSIGVENAVRNDIMKAITSKLEETVLSYAAATDDSPAGIFADFTGGNVPAASYLDSFADVTEFEAKVEEANVAGDCKYIMSPKAKAIFRNMPRSADHSRLVMENGEVDGTKALVTTHVPKNLVAYGDWSNLVVATWDNVTIDVVRDVQSVGNGVVTIVVNAFCDAKLVRPAAIAKGGAVAAS